jgi:hypothetical protein
MRGRMEEVTYRVGILMRGGCLHELRLGLPTCRDDMMLRDARCLRCTSSPDSSVLPADGKFHGLDTR